MQYQFTVSERRLKNLVPSTNALKNSEGQKLSLQEIAEQLGIPKNALAVQTKYREQSTRTFKIYGRGEYNYGVTLNADMAILFDVSYNRVKKVAPVWHPDDQKKLANVPALQIIWDYYVAAANKVGLRKEEIGAQFEMEYGVPWTLMPKAKPEWTGPQAEALKAKFKEQGLKFKKTLLEHPDAKKYIPTDENGEIIWDEAKNGQFAVMVHKIDKQDGLMEFGEA
ncbi:hypothetical protein AC578_8207 [Pseudocercospora eumusae]|uniref:Uncharacterized protein n=1 Tax=Pseudocercospora eumusae TaxID=321146 RepID=A0A139HEV5_9PEZI|nr:hypothetical protein AC578_8207 [Pseudocercospora eumusae]